MEGPPASDIQYNNSPEERSSPELERMQLPEKSKKFYEDEYRRYLEWCGESELEPTTEVTLCMYFEMMGKKFKSSSLWTKYSMLRAMFNIQHHIDINKFKRLMQLLKLHSQNYQPKKSKILQYDQISKFIEDAPNKKYLAMKVVLILGYCGACRKGELTYLTTDSVEVKQDAIFVTITDTRSKVPRFFTVTDPAWLKYVKEYAALRPKDVPNNRFFLKYYAGKCAKQPIGINTIGAMAKLIAKFLGDPDADSYSSHCFRRSSQSHLASHYGDLISIRKLRSFNAPAIMHGQIDSSLLAKKIEISKIMSNVSIMTSPSCTLQAAGGGVLDVQTTAPQNEPDVVQHVGDESRLTVHSSDLEHSSDDEIPEVKIEMESESEDAEEKEPEPVPVSVRKKRKTYSYNLEDVPGLTLNTGENCTIIVKVYNDCKFEAGKKH